MLGSLDESPQKSLRCFEALGVNGEQAQDEAPVALARGRAFQALDEETEIVRLLSAFSPGHREMPLIERLVPRSPAGRSLKSTDRLLVSARDEVDAPEGPPVKGPSAGRSEAGREPDVTRRTVDVTQGYARSRCVLMNHVRKHGHGQGLLGDLEGLREVPLFEVREVELPQQHPVGGLVEPRTRREPSSSPETA